jgi:LEA14-like dessication related protein
MKKALIIFGVLALATGLGLFWWEQYSLLALFEFDLVGLSVRNITLEAADLTLKIKLVSKSKVEFTVSKISVQVFVNGAHVGDAYQEAAQVVPAMGYNYVTIDTTIHNQDFATQLLSIAGSDPSKPITVRTIGTASVKSSFIAITEPFDQTYTTTLHELLMGTL